MQYVLQYVHASQTMERSLDAHPEADVHQARHAFLHHFGAAFCYLGQGYQRSMALLPIGRCNELDKHTGCHGSHSVPSQRQRQPVKALLTKLVQVTPARRLMFVRVSQMPLRDVLQQGPTFTASCLALWWSIDGSCLDSSPLTLGSGRLSIADHDL